MVPDEGESGFSGYRITNGDLIFGYVLVTLPDKERVVVPDRGESGFSGYQITGRDLPFEYGPVTLPDKDRVVGTGGDESRLPVTG